MRLVGALAVIGATLWPQASGGFTLVRGSADRLLISVQGTREQVNRVLGAQIGSYQYEGRLVYANSADPIVPSALAPAILGIVGLNNFGRIHRSGTAAAAPVLAAAAAAPPAVAAPAPAGPRAPGAPTPPGLSPLQIAGADHPPGGLPPPGAPAAGAGPTL